MKVKVVVHEAEEGGYWAEVPALPGCAAQGDSYKELFKNLEEALQAAREESESGDFISLEEVKREFSRAEEP